MILRLPIIFALCGLLLIGGATQAQSGTNDAQALFKQAHVKSDQGQLAEAILLYRRAVDLLPVDAGISIDLVRSLTLAREIRTEAEKSYAKAVEQSPRDVNLAIERAENLAAMGESTRSVLEYHRAFEIASDNQRACEGYIDQISHLGAGPVAIDQHSKILNRTPMNLTSRLLLAELLRSDGRYNDALDQFLIARRYAPDNPIALHGAAESWLALGYFESAKVLFLKTAAYVTEGRAVADLARVLLSSGRPEAALKALGTGFGKFAKEPSALLTLADTYRALGQPAQERATLEHLIALRPLEIVPALERLARVRFEMGDKKGSQAICEQLLMIAPGSATGALGLRLLGLSFPALDEDPKGVTTPARRAGLDQAAGEAALFWNHPELAIPRLRSALNLYPDSPRLLLALGSALLQTNDAEGAVQAFAPIAVTYGRRPDALFGLAQAEILRGDLARALDIYRSLLQIDPQNLRALSGQAEVLQRMGKSEEAAALLTELAQHAPEGGEIRARLRSVLSALGRSSGHSASVPTARETVLAAGDEVHLSVIGHPEFGGDISIDGNGMIRLPFIKEEIKAGCLTERELGAEISERGKGPLAGAAVEVVITKFHRAPLVVAGAVYLPGAFYIRSAMNLREGLMLASGTRPRAGRSVYVIRGGTTCENRLAGLNSKVVETYDRMAATEGRISLTKTLQGGDIVFVPEADAAFITGAVVRPGMVAARNHLTLLQALENLGGLQPGARSDDAKLLRLLPDGSYQQFTVNLAEIKEHRAGDVVMRPGDILEVLGSDGAETANSFAALLERAAIDALHGVTDNPPSNPVPNKPPENGTVKP